MSLVDTDLRSVQEARILLEHAEESREVLEGLPGTLVDGFLEALRERLLPNAASYAQLAVTESDYGNAEDERALIEWVLTELLDDVYAQTPTQELYSRSTTHSVEVGISKGTVVSLLPDWLCIPTMLSQLVCAVASKSPIIFSARQRTHATCEAVIEDVRKIAAECHYPLDALTFLELYAPEGEEWLAAQSAVRVLIDSRECEHIHVADATGKDVYCASIGNNPVFVEQTADLALCAEEVVYGKSFCYGMLPYVMRFHMSEPKYREPYDRLAHDLGMADADALLARVIELRECPGVENALSDLPQFEPAAFEAELSGIAEAAQHDRCTPSNLRPVSKQDLVNIARDAYCGRR